MRPCYPASTSENAAKTRSPSSLSDRWSSKKISRTAIFLPSLAWRCDLDAANSTSGSSLDADLQDAGLGVVAGDLKINEALVLQPGRPLFGC